MISYTWIRPFFIEAFLVSSLGEYASCKIEEPSKCASFVESDQLLVNLQVGFNS